VGPLRMALLCTALFLGGCAHTTYEWGHYDVELYHYYKNPENLPDLARSVEKAIAKSEEGSKPVAPGLYAEYGYLLIETGQMGEAIGYFEKEKESWPESAMFMDKMIALCKGAEEPAPEATTDGEVKQ
jgi:hypothetical protein